MKTTQVPINSLHALDHAKTLINQEHVIASPTDTVYGLMCRYDSTTAISRLYEAKGRPPQKAIPVLLGNREQLTNIVRFPVGSRATLLMEKFWPGPLTLILDAHADLPTILTAGQSTVAVRIPQHKSLRDLLDNIGPLAVTSANLSGAAETHTAAEVAAQLGGRIPLILQNELNNQEIEDENQVRGIASTIVDLSTGDLSTDDLSTGTTTDHATRDHITFKRSIKFLRNGPIYRDVQRVLDEATIAENKDRVELC